MRKCYVPVDFMKLSWWEMTKDLPKESLSSKQNKTPPKLKISRLQLIMSHYSSIYTIFTVQKIQSAALIAAGLKIFIFD